MSGFSQGIGGGLAWPGSGHHNGGMDRVVVKGGVQIELERVTLVDSTNRLARSRIEREGLSQVRAIVAREQSGGYGRHGRAWHSPAGGLWASLAWPKPVDACTGVRVGAAALGAVRRALAEVGHGPGPGTLVDRVRLKWPNDVLIDGHKVCGCLCEHVAPGLGTGAQAIAGWLIIGVGINVNNDPGALPTGLRRAPTSLRACAGRELDLDRVLALLLEELVDKLSGPVLGAIGVAAQGLARLDENVELALPDGGTTAGTLRGLSDDGRLVLQVDGRRFVAPVAAEIL